MSSVFPDVTSFTILVEWSRFMVMATEKKGIRVPVHIKIINIKAVG